MQEKSSQVKRRSHKEALRALLADRKQHHMRELIAVGGYRYGGRLFELRKNGLLIETIRLGEDEFAYRLIGEVQGSDGQYHSRPTDSDLREGQLHMPILRG
jgi:hypothetical protein